MKIVGTDNFDRDYVDDHLIAENIANEEFANVICGALNEKYCKSDHALTYYKVVVDEYQLKKFKP